MKHLSSIFMLLLLFIHPHAFSQLGLEECQRLARDNYPQIKQFNLIEKSKEMNLSNASKAYLPQLSISGMASLIDGTPEINVPGMTSTNGNHQFIGTASVSQTIWDGGYTQAQKNIIAASSEVEKQQIEVQLHEIEGRVNQLYFGILLLEKQLKQTDVLDENLSLNLTRAKNAHQNGVAYQSDIDKIMVEIINVEQNRINLNTQLTAYKQMLSIMINKSISDETELSLPIKVQRLNEPINRPEIMLFEQQKNLNELRNSAITSGYMPKFSLSGQAIGITPGIEIATRKMNHLLMASVNVSWNIGALYTQKNERNLIKLNDSKIASNKETFLFNTNLELTQTNNQIKRTERLIQRDDEIIKLRERIKKASEVRYENGSGTMTDLLIDLNAENIARQNKALHEIEYIMYIHSYNTNKQ